MILLCISLITTEVENLFLYLVSMNCPFIFFSLVKNVGLFLNN